MKSYNEVGNKRFGRKDAIKLINYQDVDVKRLEVFLRLRAVNRCYLPFRIFDRYILFLLCTEE